MKAFVDADILIWHLRGEKKTEDFLINLRYKRKYELYTGAMQRAEVAFFIRPGEKEATQLFLSLLKTKPVDKEVIDTAAVLYQK
ncbi:MAG: PIN domain-containing protein [Desulfobacula sp.]|uniref:PIN domain-containing protein n=1 Tax=Desulfobacula sp. TaxID=2593537 RepID=UPI0025C19354|nr:PIN domain-containing protein [Desulfobacula sp.]MCD4720504.1 PIN domain-containing protein [Desulfobacula sp.]